VKQGFMYAIDLFIIMVKKHATPKI